MSKGVNQLAAYKLFTELLSTYHRYSKEQMIKLLEGTIELYRALPETTKRPKPVVVPPAIEANPTVEKNELDAF